MTHRRQLELERGLTISKPTFAPSTVELTGTKLAHQARAAGAVRGIS
jgi:hypothetical protein